MPSQNTSDTQSVPNIKRSSDSLEREIVNTLAHACAIAALNAAHARGRNNRQFAGKLAVQAMRELLENELPVKSEIVIGEGERDGTPMFSNGEFLGPEDGDCCLALAVDPIEGTNLCARGEPGAISVIAGAMSGKGQLKGGVSGYFEKIVVGKDLALKIDAMKAGRAPFIYIKVDKNHGLLDNSIKNIVQWIAQTRNKPVSEVVAMVLERDRNSALIEELRALNTQVLLIRDGDITASLLALDPNRDVDLALGIGAAPEGVISAAICRVFQGYMEARSWTEKDGSAIGKNYTVDDLAQGDVMFALTGITYNQYTPGVQYSAGSAITNTIYGRSRSGTIYERRAIHQSPPPLPKFPG